MRSVTAIPAVSSAATLSGLLVIRRTLDTPSNFKTSRGQFVFAVVGCEAKFNVGLHGVAPLILQFVGLELGHQADAAPLLLLVEQDARTVGGYLAQGEFQLQAAVATERAKNIPGQALRVNPDQRRRRVDIAHNQGDEALGLWRVLICAGGCMLVAGLGRGLRSLKAKNAEGSPAGREIRLGDFLHAFNSHGFILLGVRCGCRAIRHKR